MSDQLLKQLKKIEFKKKKITLFRAPFTFADKQFCKKKII